MLVITTLPKGVFVKQDEPIFQVTVIVFTLSLLKTVTINVNTTCIETLPEKMIDKSHTFLFHPIKGTFAI